MPLTNTSIIAKFKYGNFVMIFSSHEIYRSLQEIKRFTLISIFLWLHLKAIQRQDYASGKVKDYVSFMTFDNRFDGSLKEFYIM